LELDEEFGDAAVEGYLAVGLTADVTAEVVYARGELFQDKSLCLDLAYLFDQRALDVLPEDGQFLLNNPNIDLLADDLLLLYDDLLVAAPIKVVVAIKVVKVAQGLPAVKVVETLVAAGEFAGGTV